MDHIRIRTVENISMLPEDDLLPPVSLTSQAVEDTMPQPYQPPTPLRRSTRVSKPPDRLSN